MGSAWQRGPGVGAWVRTFAGTLVRPWRTVGQIRVEKRASKGLRRVNLLAASALVSVGPAACYAVQLGRGEAPYAMRQLTGIDLGPVAAMVAGVLGVAALWVGAWALLRLLTGIEARGIRLFGRVHRSRVTPAVALAVTAHASAGWVLGGLLVTVGCGLGLVLYEVAMERNVGAVRGVLLLSPILLPSAGGVVGLLVFETVTYLGVLRCRFANRTREEPSFTEAPRT